MNRKLVRFIGKWFLALSAMAVVLSLFILSMRPVGAVLPRNDLIVLQVEGDPFGTSAENVFIVDTRTLRTYPYHLSNTGHAPVFSPDGEHLAFITLEGAGGEIYVADWTGRNARNISNHSADDAAPVWSPGGKHIAFVSRRDRNRELFIADVETGEVRRAFANDTAPLLLFLDVQWSPDGRYILINDRATLTLVDVANGERRTIDRVDVLSAAWSPDGAQIAYGVMRGAAMQLLVADVAADSVRGLDTRLLVGLSPRWSPDSKALLYVAGTTVNSADIFSMDMDENFAHNLTSGGLSDIMPAWSPDGTKIVFASMRDNQWEIYRMNADGTNTVNLSNHPAHESNPVWSPDGKQILFVSARESSLRPGVYLMNADGSHQRRIAQVEGAVTVRMWRQ